MPDIKIDRIISVSSEHSSFNASNLLAPPGSGKWKSSKPGEASISVIFQLAKPTKISGVHIGNESSSFVEVLVGKEADSSWQVGKLNYVVYLIIWR